MKSKTIGIRRAFKNPDEASIRNNELLIRPEAVAFTRLSEKGFRNAVRKGLIPEIRIGPRRVLYRKAALIEALKRLESDVVQ